MTGWRDYLELRGMVRAMSDVARLNILHQLAGGRETNVTELVLNLGISQPLVSWHLRILRRHGLVRTRRHGREVYCSLDAARYAECLRALAELVATPTPLESEPAVRASPEPPEVVATVARTERAAPLSTTAAWPRATSRSQSQSDVPDP